MNKIYFKELYTFEEFDKYISNGVALYNAEIDAYYDNLLYSKEDILRLSCTLLQSSELSTLTFEGAYATLNELHYSFFVFDVKEDADAFLHSILSIPTKFVDVIQIERLLHRSITMTEVYI